MNKVLITGGTGLVGSRLASLLKASNYEVHILSRSKKGNFNGMHYWSWDLDKQTIDNEALNVDAIIHLAGAGVADKRWTAKRKKEILDSRTLSSKLLVDILKKQSTNIQSVVAASAVGYYGSRGNEVLTEESAAGQGFLTDVCEQWESANEQFSSVLDLPLSIMRIGIVLSKNGGALPKLAMPIKFGVGAYLGNGKQYYPWIHIDDLCNMLIFAMENKLDGIYNACAPTPETNKDIAKTIASVLGRPFIPAPGPKFILKTVMGEMADMLLNSQNTSSKKIETAGFKFQFSELKTTLKEIYSA